MHTFGQSDDEAATLARARINADLDKLIEAREADEHDDPVEAALSACGALFAVATRSVADALEVLTLHEYSALAALASGPLTAGQLADHPDVAPRTLDAVLHHLLDGGWIVAVIAAQPTFELSPHGSQLVAHVTARRRSHVASILESVPARERADIARAFTAFADAAGANRGASS